MSEFNLDREMNIRNNIDAQGKKWVVHIKRGTNLCYARPEPDRTDAVIPETLGGHWTKVGLLNEKIKQYVTSSWEMAEAARAKAERKRIAAEEEQKRIRDAEKEVARKEAESIREGGQDDAGGDSVDEVALTDNAKPAQKGKAKSKT